MKLYIKQKVFTIADRSEIFDENKQSIFFVEAKLFSLGAKITMYDKEQQEVYRIEQKLFRLLSEYHIYNGASLIAIIKRKLSLLRPKLSIQSDYGSFEIIGNFIGMNFAITHNEQTIGSIKKAWLSWGDSYELQVDDQKNAALFCALTIAIDHCLFNQNHNTQA